MQELDMPHSPTSEPISDAPDSELARFGIIARQHTTYEWNGYKYSNASDAIAAAKRAAR
jgi:hypothetical protein